MKSILWAIACCGLFAASCNNIKADSIYYNGEIVTMEGDSAVYVEAVAVKDGKIIFAGKQSETEKYKDDSTAMFDLNHHAMFPGFIDGHAHFGGFQAQAIGAQILPPPDAKVTNIPQLLQTLREWNTPDNLSLTGWIFGMGYDDSQLEERRHPTKLDLDSVSKDIPIMVIHISGHFCAVNSAGLKALNITASTPDPAGGVIRRMPGSLEPNGVLEELAAIPNFQVAMAPKTPEAAARFLTAGQDMALSYGYTTAQEGRAMDSHQLLAQAAENKFFKLDVVAYIDYAYSKYMHTKWYDSNYQNHYRIAGLKLTLDGSPQGRTAWRTIPYLLPPPGQDSSYKGYPAIPNDADVAAIYDSAFKNGWQIITHTNGDAAVDQMIRCIKPSIQQYGNAKRRDVMIHGQYVREDQLDSLKKWNIMASLFPLHTFYWGDWHKQLIGDSLGNLISPTRKALKKGLHLTIHTDAPVALPNLMRVIWTAVARTSRSGAIIGEQERLTPYEALKCITDWSAYQHFEESRKGTITRDKLADFVVLDKNPLKVPMDDIKDIVVLETIKEGKSVYKK
ncbi:amidohydrolase [Pseudoflavitalea sp. G-6-1-2]|uniref:amidohydrolase n=1 Tax=Pseudoflavitalea sp. G-6-1-2 TaxID=2728841 RepID=UPI00146A7E12|nr:amidohydrolase [Pseudoflavitalea sp. G-6-1-2]NML21404.1 amidohydrolase [Pseudoflavitalea sp. G-6-1-2]